MAAALRPRRQVPIPEERGDILILLGCDSSTLRLQNDVA